MNASTTASNLLGSSFPSQILGILSMQPSALWYSANNLRLPILSSISIRQSPGIPLCSPSWPYGLQTCHGVSWDNCRSSFISHLLKVSVLCFLMSINLKTYFICFVFYFWLFGVGKLVFTCASKFMSAYYVWHGLFKVFGDMMMNKKAHAVTAA